MKISRFLGPLLRRASFAVGLVLAGSVAAAPTPAQLQMFQQLSPEQQAQAIKMYQQSSPGSGAVTTQPAITQPVLVTPRAVDTDAAIQKSAQEGTDQATLKEDAAQKTVKQKLKQFGYDLFAGTPTTFAPATDIPVPFDYVIGPGDTVEVQLFGKDNVQYSLTVSRDGQLNFPNIGPISVAGLKFSELKDNLHERIKRQMIGVTASISMGTLRSIRVFVLGDAETPGSYTVSALSTMTNALFVSGGIRPIGSLRDIQLKRNGKIVTRMDLYDLLLRGDTSKDARLQPGDVIFVPSIGTTVGVAGEVRRPAIYELKTENTAQEAIDIAGGLLPTAYAQVSQLERISDRGEKVLVDLDLNSNKGKSVPLKNGDVLRVYSVLEKMENIVLLSGHVKRPGGTQWRPGLRLTDVIPSADDLLPQAALDYVLVKRELPPDRHLAVVSARLDKAFEAPASSANITLQARDEVIVFGMEEDRKTILEPIIAQLTHQARYREPAQVVRVLGNVYQPGNYPLEQGMRVSDLIRAAGNLTESAYSLGAELSRYEIVDGQYRQTTHVPILLKDVFEGKPEANVELQSHDALNIKQLPQWTQQNVVELQGEVLFPGKYPIRKGETLKEVIQRAGGLTEFAFPQGSVFMRKDLQLKEKAQMDSMATRLESDLASLGLEQSQANPEQQQSLSFARTLLTQLRAAKPAGRLVINLPQLLDQDVGSSYDIVLNNEDILVVPSKTQEVTVLGEVQYPTSHLYEPGHGRDDYISRSGGLTYKADKNRIYVVRANGTVNVTTTSWFDDGDMDIHSGDTVVVPLDAERMRPLTLWTNVTQIIYQLGVAAAAWHTVGVF